MEAVFSVVESWISRHTIMDAKTIQYATGGVYDEAKDAQWSSHHSFCAISKGAGAERSNRRKIPEGRAGLYRIYRGQGSDQRVGHGI